MPPTLKVRGCLPSRLNPITIYSYVFMYFGKDHTTSCDENCSNCRNVNCLDHPDHARAERLQWEGAPRKCAFCGSVFTPTSPAQRYCSREENPACDDERFLSSLSPLQYIRFAGYRSKKEFIADMGPDAWAAVCK